MTKYARKKRSLTSTLNFMSATATKETNLLTVMKTIFTFCNSFVFTYLTKIKMAI